MGILYLPFRDHKPRMREIGKKTHGDGKWKEKVPAHLRLKKNDDPARKKNKRNPSPAYGNYYGI